MADKLESGAGFIWKNARLLERVRFDYYFRDGSADRIKSILKSYQTEEGGFDQALEPDLRAPDSHPIFMEFALVTLYDCNIRDPEIAYRACNYLAKYSDLSRGIPDIFPSAAHYPHAKHWSNPASQQPSMDRLVGLVGLLNWQGISHPWLPGAVEACLRFITVNHFSDAHILHTAFRLLESITYSKESSELFDKLAADLLKADYFILNAPVTTYGLTPLVFAPSPDSFCRRIFTDAQIEGHLDDLTAQQQLDGGWPILWNPPEGIAHMEWRALRTVQALSTLRAYGRI